MGRPRKQETIGKKVMDAEALGNEAAQGVRRSAFRAEDPARAAKVDASPATPGCHGQEGEILR